MKFSPHGEIELQWEGNLLVSTVCGPINYEGALMFFDRLKGSVKNQNIQNSWKWIEQICNEDTLGSPDVLNIYCEALLWAQSNKLCQYILVCKSMTIANAMTRSLKKAHVEFEVVSDLGEAMKRVSTLK